MDVAQIFLKFGGRSRLEQCVGDAAVAAGKGDFALAPGDFGFQRRNPFFKFGNRQRVEILPDQIGQRIVAAQRQIFVAIHGACFDTTTLAVNMEPS